MKRLIFLVGFLFETGLFGQPTYGPYPVPLTPGTTVPVSTIPVTSFWATNFPDTNYNGLYIPRFQSYSITNGSPSQILPIFDYTNRSRSSYHFTNDVGEGFFLLTSNQGVNAVIANGGYLVAPLAGMNISNNWQDVDANPITGSMQPTNSGTTIVSVPFNNTTPQNSIRVSTNGIDASAATGYGSFRSFETAVLTTFSPFDILLNSGVYDSGLPTVDNLTLLPNQGVFGSPSSITYISSSGITLSGQSNIVQDVTLINGAQIERNDNVGSLFNRMSVIEYSGGSGDSFAINYMTNCMFKNCYILGWENSFQGAGYGTNVVQDCHIVGITVSGHQSAVPFYSAISTVGTNLGWFRFLGDNSIEANNVANGSGTSACITCNETNCVYDIRYGALHLIHDANAIGINDGTKGSIVMLGAYTDNGTNMLCDGMPGHIGIIPTQVAYTNIGNLATTLQITLPNGYYDTNYIPVVSFLGTTPTALGVQYSNGIDRCFITLSAGIAGGDSIRLLTTHK